MSSKDRKTRRLALLVLLTLLQDNTVFFRYLDCMCLPTIPGFVFINNRMLKTKDLESFHTFWIQNKQALKHPNYKITFFDIKFNSLIELQLDELKKLFRAGAVNDLIDPAKVPLLVNFQPSAISKRIKSRSKENKTTQGEKINKSNNKLKDIVNSKKIMKTTLPNPVKFSTTTNSLYNQLSKPIRNLK